MKKHNIVQFPLPKKSAEDLISSLGTEVLDIQTKISDVEDLIDDLESYISELEETIKNNVAFKPKNLTEENFKEWVEKQLTNYRNGVGTLPTC